MSFIFFPNGLKVSEDGRTIYLPNDAVIRLSESGEVITTDKKVDIAEIKYPFTCFDFIGENERHLVERHFAKGKRLYQNDYERRFYCELSEAIREVNYDYYLARYPASVDGKGKIFYKEGAKVAMGYTKEAWEIMAKDFLPQYNSDIATLSEYLIWIAYSILQKRWTLESLTTDNGILESDPFWHTRKLVRRNGIFIRCGYDEYITRSPARIPLKIHYGGFCDFATPNSRCYTGIVSFRA